MADKLIVKDLGKPLDGEYEFEIVDIISRGRPGSLTGRELHAIRLRCGLRGGEILDGFLYGDEGLMLSLAEILIARTGTTMTEERVAKLWDTNGCTDWEITTLTAEPLEDESNPPAEPAATPENASGGTSSALISAQSQNDPSGTGHPGSETSATYVPLTSVR